MKVCKWSVCKEPIFYQSGHEKSLSRYYTLCFCIKQYNFHLLIYSQPPAICHFTNWEHVSHFPWTTAPTRTFATSMLCCYNFSGVIEWYDISCATLYLSYPLLLNTSPLSSTWRTRTSFNVPWMLKSLQYVYYTHHIRRNTKGCLWILPHYLVVV